MDRAGASSQREIDSTISSLKEIHQMNYVTEEINLRATIIHQKEPHIRSQLIRSAPPANMIYLF
jgi:hypothetical protein